MTSFSVLVEVRLRPGIADPAATTVERSLPALGVGNVHGVHIGKAIRFSLDAEDEAAAQAQTEDLCRRFLTNPVIEDALITITVDLSVTHEAPAHPAGTS